jgi:6-phospho-3-hexuloisomerase
MPETVWSATAMNMRADVTAQAALAEISSIFDQVAAGELDRFAVAILSAKRVHCYGLGREGLMLRALCMRLMHLGFDAHLVGDVTAPPAAPGDLMIVTSGPGDLTLARAMISLGKRAGATVLVMTAQPDGPDPRAADIVITLPAQTMADDQQSGGILPMGTAFEIALLLFFDLAAIRLRDLTGQTDEQVRARHANLE